MGLKKRTKAALSRIHPQLSEGAEERPVASSLLFAHVGVDVRLPFATPLPSTGTERDSRRHGSSGWTAVGSAECSRSQAGSGDLRRGRKPLVAARRHRKKLNTENSTGTTLLLRV